MRGARSSPQLPVVSGTPETQGRKGTGRLGLADGKRWAVRVHMVGRRPTQSLMPGFHLAIKDASVLSITVLEIKGKLRNIIAISMHDVSLSSF